MIAIQFYGPVWDISGIALSLRSIAIALYDAGIQVHIIEMDKWSGLRANLDQATVTKLQAMLTGPVPKDAVFVNFVPPPRILQQRNDAYANVAWSLFETDRIPSVWPMIIEQQNVDEVWVASKFNEESFIRGGIPADKIHVINFGVNTKQYNTNVKPIKIRNQKGFSFLTIMDLKECKGYDILLDAYFQEFSKDDDVSLIFKAYSGDLGKANQDRIHGIIRAAKERNKSTAEVLFIGGNVSDNLIPGLHKTANAYILPSKGEGWSLGTIQSMACGVPAIMTNATGYLDYMNNTNGILLECEKKPINSINWLIREPYQQGHYWWETTVAETRSKMRWAYDHPDELKVLGTKAAEDVKAFTWNHTAQEVIKNLYRIEHS